MKISKCKTNGVKNPIGFAMEHVTVSWIAESEQSSEQTKSKIVVATDNGMKNIIYSSDLDAVLDSTGTKLPITLQPCTRYFWTVQVWGNEGDVAISEVNYFETGKRGVELEGNWITTPWSNKSISPYIRKKIKIVLFIFQIYF